MDLRQLKYKLLQQVPGKDETQGDESFLLGHLAIDPGETIGWSYFERLDLISSGEIKITNKSIPEVADRIRQMLNELNPKVVVIEDYLIYKWKTDSHAWNDVFTIRAIGSIETVVHHYNPEIRVVKRMAQHAKKFCTDKKLHEWNMYIVGKGHARDSIRHGCFELLFGGK